MNAAEKVQQFLDQEGLVLEARPEFVSRDDGTFGVVVRVIVNELPPAPENEVSSESEGKKDVT
jgi:hypothetical protein